MYFIKKENIYQKNFLKQGIEEYFCELAQLYFYLYSNIER